MRRKHLARFARNFEGEFGVMQRYFQRVGAIVAIRQAEVVLFDEIVDRDLTLVLLIGRAAANRSLIERHRHETISPWLLRAHEFVRPSRKATERAWASRPSALPRAIAGGPSAARLSGEHFRIDVRFMKSSTPRPDEKRAERAVGNTWFEPPT